MVRLKPMPQAYFARFVDEAVVRYARDTVAAGRWNAGEAAARSLAELERYLPAGIQTPGHDVCLIECEEAGGVVGTVWYGPVVWGERPTVCVFDLCIYPDHRRRGYAAAALGQVEVAARGRNVESVVLHVFAHNLPAQALYRKLGFKPLEGLMVKRLGDAP